ncbi:Alcohol acetyltransferase [Neonectria punicea]|uniref:Alcohol acetyltransferase n=1 Tax=Neonectria punicea TaxID=979145 RepID=A0ABR1GR23_9HYPO
MSDHKKFLRYASPNEQRTVTREDFGFYHAVIVGAVYEFGNEVDLKSPETFFHPLTRCILQHPWLCVVVGDKHTDKSFYEQVARIDLKNHISIAHASTDEDITMIQKVLEADVDKPFSPEIPPWRILVVPTQPGRCFIAFSFSHSICDGLSGACFHRSFLEACKALPDVATSSTVETPTRPLPAPFDTPERLPISWSYLLGPLFAALIPKFLANLLGIQASVSIVDKGSWTASPGSFNPETHHTEVRAFEVEKSLVNNAIVVSRKHNAKLTATIHQLINRALSQAIPDPDVTNFISQTAINMRKAVGIPEDEMGEFVSGCYLYHPRPSASGPLTDEEWAAIAECTRKFAANAVRLQDQPTGLLRYVPSIRKWTLRGLGETRESSYGMSNLGSMEGGADKEDAKITKMVFTQPGHASGPPIIFNFASVKGKSLVCTVTWHSGTLGVSEDEGQFIDRVCASVKAGFNDLV